MLIKMLSKIFSFVFNNKNDEENIEHEEEDTDRPRRLPAVGFSYLFQKKNFIFDENISFLLRYLYDKDEVWILYFDLSDGVGLPEDARDSISYQNIKTVNELLPKQSSQISRVECINKHGMLEALESISFKSKAQLVTKLLDMFAELESKSTPLSKMDHKFDVLLKAIQEVKNDNANLFKIQLDRCQDFERKITELDKKISLYENIDHLYERLRERHKATASDRHMFLDDNNEMTIKLPKDVSKHPRIAVFMKPSQAGTKVAFVSGQKKYLQKGKRKFQDMELVYDGVHPNPQMAVNCIAEELDFKNFDYIKKARLYYLNCNLETAKSFIKENL
ncbi:38.7K [Cryptophlebia peltastica nucleopolyhedrovirus]|uniref:38.7K n=1 Tax=Cryptophlebia peltastica nucleopolyhedrovirus TaxID=2304025 RepID=A0A346RNZ4_9ABAC|nr:38.7K [Cryptophlebia peltastica nucleopolyhedrovirus]AXS67791.1 38.7K [Cryptophlebia peltastica nucleopolyhedrovirus]